MQNNNTAPQKMVRVTIRIDAELKREVFAIFKTLGVTPSDAIRGFLREVARTGKMPFSYDSVQHDAWSKECMKPITTAIQAVTDEQLQEFVTTLRP